MIGKMKYFLISVAVLGLMGVIPGIASGATSNTDSLTLSNADAGLTPASPFYFIETFSEGIGDLFTFGEKNKAQRSVKLANERLAESVAISSGDDTQLLENTLNDYETEVKEALDNVQKAQQKGQGIEDVSEKVAKATSKHFQVLDEVLEKTPKEAEKGISKALSESKKGHINAVNSLAKENSQKAAKINSQSMERILEQAQKKIQQGDKEETKKSLQDYQNFQKNLNKIASKSKNADEAASKGMLKSMEALNKMDESVPSDLESQFKDLKDSTQKNATRSLRSLANSDAESAIKLVQEATDKALNQAKKASEEGNVDKIKKAVDEFDKQYGKMSEEVYKAAEVANEDAAKVKDLIRNSTTKNLETLSEVYNEVPQEAKSAIENAMQNSLEGTEKALQQKKSQSLKKALQGVSVEIEIEGEGMKANVKGANADRGDSSQGDQQGNADDQDSSGTSGNKPDNVDTGEGSQGEGGSIAPGSNSGAGNQGSTN